VSIALIDISFLGILIIPQAEKSRMPTCYYICDQCEERGPPIRNAIWKFRKENPDHSHDYDFHSTTHPLIRVPSLVEFKDKMDPFAETINSMEAEMRRQFDRLNARMDRLEGLLRALPNAGCGGQGGHVRNEDGLSK
jgi:hypothetical protein